jgi:CRISPR/Cas system-associated protein Csm6
MWVVRLLRRIGNEQAVDNARAASTELARLRVEREAVEIFLRVRAGSRPAGPAPVAVEG